MIPIVRPSLRQRASGFTLVELMVALALAALISVSIVFISSQARLAYDGTVKKVDVYNRFRFIYKALESDIRNWIPTSELEFYTDGRGRGAKYNNHWDYGEELPDRQDEYGFGMVDGGDIGEFDEYAYLLERQYKSREKGQTDDKLHDAFQLYFRTSTFVGGQMRVATVEYMLVDPNYAKNNDGQAPPAPPKGGPRKVDPAPRAVKTEHTAQLSLIKIVRYVDGHYGMVEKPNELFVKRQVVEVASNVTDFTVEYMLERDFRGKIKPEFLRPSEEFARPGEIVARPRQVQASGTVGNVYRKHFGYGSAKLSEKVQRASAFPSRRGDDNLAKGAGGRDHTPIRFGFQGNQEISFAQLIPGDKVFAFLASSRGEAAQGGAAGRADQFLRFPPGDYTVRTNLDGLLEFEEDVDSTDWNGQAQNEIYYKAAYLPAAIRVTLRIMDDNGENPKTLQREIWLRGRSR